MKKALLLSVVASSMIMAGGDIAPVEPVVEAPAAEVASWEFGGQAVLYYQTGTGRDWVGVDAMGEGAGKMDTGDMFSAENAGAAAGIQLSAVNKDIIGGLGAGVELTGISDLGLYDGVVGGLMQSAGNQIGGSDVDAAASITQAYLTYGFDNTSFKIGRQNLPKALSPFAFSEGWNVFKNSFEAALVVNTDITDTTLVGAYVTNANSIMQLRDFNEINEDGIFMLTAQNTSLEGVTLTGTWYYAPDMAANLGGAAGEDANILWGDAKFAVAGLNVGLQAGTILTGESVAAHVDTTAFGAMIGGTFDGISASLAFSSVDDGTLPIQNLVGEIGRSGLQTGGVKTPLYTQMILNQDFIKSDSDTVVARVGMAALGGNVGAAFNYSDVSGEDYMELDLTYKTKVGENTTVFAGYVYQTGDALTADIVGPVTSSVTADTDSNNFVRVWARYDF